MGLREKDNQDMRWEKVQQIMSASAEQVYGKRQLKYKSMVEYT